MYEGAYNNKTACCYFEGVRINNIIVFLWKWGEYNTLITGL